MNLRRRAAVSLVGVLLSGLAVGLSACKHDRTVDHNLPEVLSPAKPSTLHLEPVPTTLDAALNSLDRASSGAVILKMRSGDESVATELHDSLGRWIRNNWQLYDRGQLYHQLAGLGLKYPDDMSDLILTSWWHRMHGRPLRVEEQVRAYQEFNERHPALPSPRAPR
jgi:hypothetical protein